MHQCINTTDVLFCKEYFRQKYELKVNSFSLSPCELKGCVNLLTHVSLRFNGKTAAAFNIVYIPNQLINIALQMSSCFVKYKCGVFS